MTATVAGAPTPATLNLTNLAGTASHLAFIQQPTDAVTGQAVAPAGRCSWSTAPAIRLPLRA